MNMCELSGITVLKGRFGEETGTSVNMTGGWADGT
jgi:hypothetical protein